MAAAVLLPLLVPVALALLLLVRAAVARARAWRSARRFRRAMVGRVLRTSDGRTHRITDASRATITVDGELEAPPPGAAFELRDAGR